MLNNFNFTLLLMDMTGKYSIKDLELISGIKAHTLRIWEQRYNILSPERTDTNIRYYSNDDLKKILNVSFLNKNGIKISKIAELNEYQISEKIKTIYVKESDFDDQIHQLIISMVDVDESRFEKIISSNVIRMGFVDTIEKIVFPFLRTTGVMWQAGSVNPAQEHFVSNLIRQKIISAIDSQVVLQTIGAVKKIIFFLPEGELHELALLYYSFLAKNKGYGSIYLGQSVPLNDLKKVCDLRRADVLASVITQPIKNGELKDYIKELSALFPEQLILLSGAQIAGHKKAAPKNIRLFHNYDQFKNLI